MRIRETFVLSSTVNWICWNMLALRAKTEAEWILAHAPSLSEFLFFRYLNKESSGLLRQAQSGEVIEDVRSRFAFAYWLQAPAMALHVMPDAQNKKATRLDGFCIDRKCWSFAPRLKRGGFWCTHCICRNFCFSDTF